MEGLIVVGSVVGILSLIQFAVWWLLKGDAPAPTPAIQKEKTRFERVLDLIRVGEIVVKLNSDGNKRWINLFDKSGTHLVGFRSENGVWPHHERNSIWPFGHEFLGLNKVTGEHLAKIHNATLPSVEDLENSYRERIKQEVKSELDEQLADFDRRLKEVLK